ncbi:hypothetical protein OH491_24170 [Termitidicoccus mucosus]|uniref:Uncharacterized protein n=1 Tax=Termitidicoccus mucosus TaxID=1184151 RepID=A0A178IQJ9_9BACT|nr:hypothetical protein AW736_02285 [Opitutaceae bacterium TSB47]
MHIFTAGLCAAIIPGLTASILFLILKPAKKHAWAATFAGCAILSAIGFFNLPLAWLLPGEKTILTVLYFTGPVIFLGAGLPARGKSKAAATSGLLLLLMAGFFIAFKKSAPLDAAGRKLPAALEAPLRTRAIELLRENLSAQILKKPGGETVIEGPFKLPILGNPGTFCLNSLLEGLLATGQIPRHFHAILKCEPEIHSLRATRHDFNGTEIPTLSLQGGAAFRLTVIPIPENPARGHVPKSLALLLPVTALLASDNTQKPELLQLQIKQPGPGRRPDF